MSAFWWSLVAVYVAGYLWSWRSLFRWMFDDLGGENMADLVFVVFFASFFNLGWPLGRVCHVINRWDTQVIAVTLGGRSEESKRLRSLERAKRIADLERELGIR